MSLEFRKMVRAKYIQFGGIRYATYLGYQLAHLSYLPHLN